MYQSVNHPSTDSVFSTFEQVSYGYSPEQVQDLIEQTVEKFQAEGAAAVVDSIFDDPQATGSKIDQNFSLYFPQKITLLISSSG